MEKSSNKGLIIAIVIGIIIVGVSVTIIAMNVFNSNKPVAPNAGGNTPNDVVKNDIKNNNVQNNNINNSVGNNDTTDDPVKDPNSISNLASKYPNATTAELAIIKSMREKYNNASDTTIVKNLLDAKDKDSACIFLENGNPNITTILDDYYAYYSKLVGLNCLNTTQYNVVEKISKEKQKEVLESTKTQIAKMSIDDCHARLDNESYQLVNNTVVFKLSELNLSEIIIMPFINPVTEKAVDLEKSTVVYTNKCAVKSVTIIDKK